MLYKYKMDETVSSIYWGFLEINQNLQMFRKLYLRPSLHWESLEAKVIPHTSQSVTKLQSRIFPVLPVHRIVISIYAPWQSVVSVSLLHVTGLGSSESQYTPGDQTWPQPQSGEWEPEAGGLSSWLGIPWPPPPPSRHWPPPPPHELGPWPRLWARPWCGITPVLQHTGILETILASCPTVASSAWMTSFAE